MNEKKNMVSPEQRLEQLREKGLVFSSINSNVNSIAVLDPEAITELVGTTTKKLVLERFVKIDKKAVVFSKPLAETIGLFRAISEEIATKVQAKVLPQKFLDMAATKPPGSVSEEKLAAKRADLEEAEKSYSNFLDSVQEIYPFFEQALDEIIANNQQLIGQIREGMTKIEEHAAGLDTLVQTKDQETFQANASEMMQLFREMIDDFEGTLTQSEINQFSANLDSFDREKVGHDLLEEKKLLMSLLNDFGGLRTWIVNSHELLLSLVDGIKRRFKVSE